MSHDKTIGDGPIILACLLGVASQILIGRRLRIPVKLNGAVAFVLLAIYLLTDSDKFPAIYDAFPSAPIGVVHSLIFLWFFCLVLIEILCY